MELFTISLPSHCLQSLGKLMSMLAEQADADLHMNLSSNGQPLVEYAQAADNGIQCVARLPHFQLSVHGSAVYKSAAGVLAEFVVTEMEPGMLSAIIKRKYGSIDEADFNAIEQYCHNILYGKEWDQLGNRFIDADRKRRKSKIADEIDQYLNVNSMLHLHGFANFRLGQYRKELQEVVEYALDEYVLDKQYQEFISLVRYFVGLQETKIDMVHLLHKGGHEFSLYNDSFQPLEPKPPTDRIVADMLEAEMNIEDMVISSLISISPKQITIHTRQPELSVIRTIESIFDKRVKVCVQCGLCKLTLDELARQ